MTRKIIKSDFPRVCRTCLNFDTNKISLQTTGITNMFEACTSLRITDSDDLPDSICLACYDKINEFYSFKLKCEHFDRLLRKLQTENSNKILCIKIKNTADEKVCLLEELVENSVNDEDSVNHSKSKQDVKSKNISEPSIKLKESNLIQSGESFQEVLVKNESPLSEDAVECNSNNDEFDNINDMQSQSPENEEINVEDSYNSFIERKKRKEILQHKREKYLTPDKCDVDTLTCKICKKTLTTIHVLLRHIESHDENRAFQCYCSVCNKGFYETGHLTKHMRRHKGETRYKCEECDKPFYELAALAVHARKSHNTQPTACTMCNKQFILKLQLDIHMETHRFRQTHTCEQCGQTFSNYWKLKSHHFKHINERMYKCHVCSASFKRLPFLKKHQIKYHTEEKQNVYTNCTVCGKQLTAENMKMHMLRRHSEEKLFQCTQCKKSYATEKLLKWHSKMIHEKKYAEKKEKTYFLCPICGKKLSSASRFYFHQQVHSDTKRFTCKYCNNTYKYRTGLLMHLKNHTGERPHQCAVCQKRFKDTTTLKKHVLIHTGERPYICHICDKNFNQKSALKTHMKIHGKPLT